MSITHFLKFNSLEENLFRKSKSNGTEELAGENQLAVLEIPGFRSFTDNYHGSEMKFDYMCLVLVG